LNEDIVGTIKAGEDAVDIFGWDASACVAHLNQDIFLAVFALGLYFESHGSFHRGGGAGVLQEVDQNLLQGFTVGINGCNILWQVEMHGNIFLTYLAARVGHGIIDNNIQIDRFRLEFVESGLECGDLNQVIDQIANALRGSLDAFDELAL
jgi:hypothetical protein